MISLLSICVDHYFVLHFSSTVYCVFATIDIPSAGGGPLGVFPIAMSVMVSHLFLIPIDGCSINPSRSFGPSLVAAMAGIPGRYYYQQYMFWFGPMIGAALAALIYGMSCRFCLMVRMVISLPCGHPLIPPLSRSSLPLPPVLTPPHSTSPPLLQNMPHSNQRSEIRKRI